MSIGPRRAADFRHHAGDLGLVGHIPHDDARGAAQRLDLPHGVGRLVARGFRIHRNGGAFARQRQRNGTADPPHAAGDERHLPGKFALDIDVTCWVPASKSSRGIALACRRIEWNSGASLEEPLNSLP